MSLRNEEFTWKQIRMAKTEKLREEFSEKGKSYVHQHYSMDAMCQKYEQLFYHLSH